MAMNFAAPNINNPKLEIKKEIVTMAYDNGPTGITTSGSGNGSSSSSIIFGYSGSNSLLLNGGNAGITCRMCGKYEYGSNGEFETIKLGDLFPNMSSSAISSPCAETTVAVGLCCNCQKGRSSVNPIFQQAQAVIKSENRSSLLLQHQQNLMPSMFRSWNSSNGNGNGNDRDLTTSTQQYFPKGRQNFTPSTNTSITEAGLTVSVLSATNTTKKSPGGLNLKNSSISISTTPTNNKLANVPMPMALNLNLLASASVLSSEGLVMGKKSSPTTNPIPTLTSGTGTETIAKRNQSRDCSICNRTFKSAKIAEQHVRRVHNNVGSYCCDICGALFSYRGSLDSHLASHKPPLITHDCPTCGQKFKEKSNLNTHLKLHSDTPKKFKCEFCPSGFSKKVNLRTHTKRKHPDHVMNTNYQMPPDQYNNNGNGVGGLTYPSTSTALGTQNLPTKNNNSDKPEGNFKCEHCGRGFLFKNNLKAHLRTHTRDRKYTCQICEKSFIYKESLKNHMLLHSNEVPYQCDICLKKFRDRSNRRKHVKNVHKYVFVNGDSSTLAPIGSRPGESGAQSVTGSSIPGMQSQSLPAETAPAKKTRRRNNKAANTNQSADSTTVIKPKRSRKKNLASSSGNNSSVIVSNASCSDQDRKIIMSPGPKVNTGQQSLEYNIHPQNLPITVHVPSASPMFGRNVIVKATGMPTSTSVPLPRFSDPYNRDSNSNPSVPMQQNVIVYPKPKHSLLETYTSEPQSSVISQHLSQYYTTSVQSQGGLPIGVAYPEPNSSYGALLAPSPRSITPSNPGNNAFESYVLSENRRNSGGSTSKSPPDSNVVTHSQYSASPGPVFSTQGPLRAEPYFWTPADNVNQSVSHGHVSPYYTSPQHSSTPTPTPNPILDNSGNVLNTPSYSQGSEIVGGMDSSVSASITIPAVTNIATSSNPNSFYYKDFDFSYL